MQNPRHRPAVHPLASAIVPVLLWAWLFHHLHLEWSLNAQYNYGWAVPFLAGLAFYLRWPDRPEPQPLSTGWIFVAMAGLLALLLPLRWIEVANPDWRLLSWALAFIVVAFSLLSLARTGGAGWVRHFAFPVCFPLVAVPWLAQIENRIVQALTGAVTFAAVEIAGWIGIGVLQLGNIIELHNGFVGVDDACSGVKTLQAAVMVSLILGELFQLTVTRRIVLLLTGCTWMFACNVLRATTLVAIAARDGTAALDQWHDTIGTAVLIAGMAGLLLLGWFMRTAAAPAPSSDSYPPAPVAPFTLRFTTAAAAWLLTIFIATELWYRASERHLIAQPPWSVAWPTDNPTHQQLPVTDTVRAILRFDEASTAAWQEPNGTRWWGFYSRWKPQRAALQLVRSHSPEICLPAIGRTFVQELEPITIAARDVQLPFRVFEFDERGRPLWVFVCIQEDKTADATVIEHAEWNARGRVLAAVRGHRNLGQRLLELAVAGVSEYAAAEGELSRAVDQLVQSGNTPAAGIAIADAN
jgi:exosortase